MKVGLHCERGLLHLACDRKQYMEQVAEYKMPSTM